MNYLNLVIAVVLAVGGFGAGWQVKSWQVDSVELAATTAANTIAKEEAKRESKIAKDVVAALNAATIKERHYYHKTHEVTKREIYSKECIDADGLLIIDGLRRMPGTGTGATSNPVN